ncbi:MAG: hypothetical protein V1778_04300 [bacterium]
MQKETTKDVAALRRRKRLRHAVEALLERNELPIPRLRWSHGVLWDDQGLEYADAQSNTINRGTCNRLRTQHLLAHAPYLFRGPEPIFQPCPWERGGP